MPVLVSKYLVPNGFRAITIFPFIFLKNASDKKDRVLLNHERIHLKQQLELLIFLFYFWYLIDYGWKRLRGYDKFSAYKNISFEREAYGNEYDMTYLSRRKFWGFLKYLKSTN